MFERKIAVVSAMLIPLFSVAMLMPPVFCQESGEYTAEIADNGEQTDITNGMAEQNGMYAIRNGKHVRNQDLGYAPQVLRGYASNQHPNLQGQIQNPESTLYGQADNQGCNGQNPAYGRQDPSMVQQGYIVEGQGYMPQSGYVPMQTPMQGQAPMQGVVQEQTLFGNASQALGLGDAGINLSGIGITTTQVVGAVGAAVMFNYMTQGGAQTVFSHMGARGWGGRRHTFGSGGMVSH